MRTVAGVSATVRIVRSVGGRPPSGVGDRPFWAVVTVFRGLVPLRCGAGWEDDATSLSYPRHLVRKRDRLSRLHFGAIRVGAERGGGDSGPDWHRRRGAGCSAGYDGAGDASAGWE